MTTWTAMVVQCLMLHKKNLQIDLVIQQPLKSVGACLHLPRTVTGVV